MRLASKHDRCSMKTLIDRVLTKVGKGKGFGPEKKKEEAVKKP